VKRNRLGVDEALFEAKPASGGWFAIIFSADNRLNIGHLYGISFVWATNAVFRDTSAWMHVVAVCDTTSSTPTITGTSTDRLRLYVNGVQQSLGVFDSPPPAAPPAQNSDLQINDTVPHYIGRFSALITYSSFQIADVHFIDGQALDPTSFGEFSATTGVWMPKAYTGSYGTNGFRLTFADNSAATATTLGKDAAGSNNWTPNNLSVTAGAGNDSLVDVPTNGAQTDTGVGGEVRGNYCTLNPLDNPGNTLSNGNLDLVGAGNSFHGVRGTLSPSSGKWYFECTIVAEGGETRTGPGLYRPTDVLTGDYGNGTVVIYDYEGTLYVRDESGAGSTWYSVAGTVSAGDLFGFAFDLDAAKVWIHKNGTWLNSGNPAAGTGEVVSSLPSGTYFPGGWGYNTSDNLVFNFGQRAFAYNTNRSGFKALNTANLPAPVVTKPSTAFDVKLYTGNGSTQTISGLAFSPDLVWIKERNASADHALYDVIRGVERRLESNTTDAEVGSNDSGVTAFNSDGFSLGTLAQVNTNNDTYVAWTWDAGSSTVTNTSGSISSQVRANPTAGFSIFTHTGNGVSGATIGHGLNAVPEFFVVKSRSTTATDWLVYHKALGATSFLLMASTNGTGSNATAWNNTSPTSSLITFGNSVFCNGNGLTYVTYAWAPVAGYSSFGSYTGNGSSDGVFVYTGFRPRFVLFKRTDSSGQWTMYDTARDSSNVSKTPLAPNESTAESGFLSEYNLDILSNGFKWRDAGAVNNASGGTYIYAAFAESPFNYARAR
jgi:hypothetical protein